MLMIEILDSHENSYGQGCRNAMLDLAKAGPMSFRTSEKFLLTCPGTSTKKVNAILFLQSCLYRTSKAVVICTHIFLLY